MALFQSLIGTLQTKQLLYELNLECMFQSLIGTLQTLFLSLGYSFICVFQSLIGTLQTSPDVIDFVKKFKVSIPYRYATN